MPLSATSGDECGYLSAVFSIRTPMRPRLAVLLVSLLYVTPVAADGPTGADCPGMTPCAATAGQENTMQDMMTGDWGGVRPRLIEAGIEPEVIYVADILANPVGGERQGWAYAHYLGAQLMFDLGRLAGLDGLSLFAQGNWSRGQNLSAEDIGNFFPVAHAYTGSQVALAQLYLQQLLFDDALAVAVGRLTPNQTFAYLPIFVSYLNSSVNLSPFALYANDFGFFGLPGAEWGARAVMSFADGWHAGAGAFLPDETASVAGDNGLHFRFQPDDGVMVIAEVGYAAPAPDRGTSPFEFKLGGLYDSRAFDRVGQPGETVGDNYAIYLSGQRKVYSEPGSSEEGLSPWINVVYAPKKRASPLPLFLATGAVYQGLLPRRPDDRTAVGVFFGRFSSDLDDQSAETIIELSHTFRVTPWLSVVPDFQYVFTPNGQSKIDNAVVFGGEIAVTF
jgi:Carbohydrate-selective porin